jgi:hypothetical protein
LALKYEIMAYLVNQNNTILLEVLITEELYVHCFDKLPLSKYLSRTVCSRVKKGLENGQALQSSTQRQFTLPPPV